METTRKLLIISFIFMLQGCNKEQSYIADIGNYAEELYTSANDKFKSLKRTNVKKHAKQKPITVSRKYRLINPKKLKRASTAVEKNNTEVLKSAKIAPPSKFVSSEISEAIEEKDTTYTVKSGDTLYKIAKKYDVCHDLLKSQNKLINTELRVGQILTIPSKHIHWRWPANGKIVNSYRQTRDSYNGIEIHGEKGSPIVAAAPGIVVYQGNALRGYGNLIIIKHNNQYLTAYAHNQEVFVKENDIIIAGQKIACMGSSGTDMTKLHFEIRSNGKPVSPVALLDNSKTIG